MEITVLKTNNLSKRYKRTIAVDGVSINLQKGDIYGLIGPNGAGKTTVIKLITSLVSSTDGTIELFGKTEKTELDKMRKKIGCIIEYPIFYSGLSAYDNLKYYCIRLGIKDEKAIENALNLVNLTETDKKKFKEFSLGMKQRLGIALAVLNKPEVLILDEPLNGLDPMGIIEIREMLQDLNKNYGVTILISSHILGELSQVANYYGIMKEGRLIKQFSKDQLEADCKLGILIKVDDVEKAVFLLKTVLHIEQMELYPNNEIAIFDQTYHLGELVFQLNKKGVRVNHSKEITINLEQYYRNLIGKREN